MWGVRSPAAVEGSPKPCGTPVIPTKTCPHPTVAGGHAREQGPEETVRGSDSWRRDGEG